MSKIASWVCSAVALAGTAFSQQDVHNKPQDDPRLNRLAYFLEANHSPFKNLAQDFLTAADRNGLDWRLLPSISLIETGGGRTAQANNIFGWDSARKGFATVRHGIYEVATRLAHSKLYRDKDLDSALRTYNRRPGYAARVKRLMRLVEPTEPLGARWLIAVAD